MRFHTIATLAISACVGLWAQPAGDMPVALKVGDVAPNFTLSGTNRTKITLSDFKGKNPVVLAFFPAAFTGG